MDTLKLQKMWPELHSDMVKACLRSIPADVAICMPEEMLVATVRSFAETLKTEVNRVTSKP